MKFYKSIEGDSVISGIEYNSLSLLGKYQFEEIPEGVHYYSFYSKAMEDVKNPCRESEQTSAISPDSWSVVGTQNALGKAFHLTTTIDGERYNIGDGNMYTKNELLDKFGIKVSK